MNKQQLAAKIWESANQMRSKIEANEYKDYILGFIFYKYLSDQLVQFVRDQGMTADDIKALNESDTETIEFIQGDLGYFIAYDNLFSTWVDPKFDFDESNVRDALSAFSRLIHPKHKKLFEGIFTTLETGLSKLGESAGKRTKAISDLLHLIKSIPMNGNLGYDVLGYIYEYLIEKFAANAGKKAGEFYTPHEVSVLMSLIVAHELKNKDRIRIYDPTSGSGSLLINIGNAVAQYAKNKDSIEYYAQELKANTYNLTRMNLIMRGINPDNIKTRNGDTLEDDWPYFDENDPLGTYQALYVDAVVSNPPYSQQWDPSHKESDPRYSRFGLAPKTKADFAFLLHDLYHLKPDGVMTIVLPHGVLFRGGEEGEIRKQLIENEHIDAIIGLPANIFFGTGIPTVILVLKQKRKNNDVLVVDASKHFIKEGKNNKLQASDIKRIVDVVINRESRPKFSQVVSKQTIRDNGYNLNIPRYVDSSPAAESWDLHATMLGGVPNSEIAELQDYWQALPKLHSALFTAKSSAYSELATEKSAVNAVITQHPQVVSFIKAYDQAFKGFDEYLNTRLIHGWQTLNRNQQEAELSVELFKRLEPIALIDKYQAYQLLNNQWQTISADLEMMQTEGFAATTQVDPNMVIKKKDGKDTEVQDGWKGHILPFELVQKTLLADDLRALEQQENRLAEIASNLEEILESLTEEEKEGEAVKESKDGFANAEVNKAAKAFLKEQKDSKVKFAQESYEAKIIRASKLIEEEKDLKKAVKEAATALHLKTKTTIEGLADEQVNNLLHLKWIVPLCSELAAMPSSVITQLTTQVQNLADKYAVTYSQVANDIKTTEQELADMLGELAGNEFDMQGLAELTRLLKGNDKLSTIKKSMLGKMFPKQGETVPEIRFKGFGGEWGARSWRDTVDISTNMVDPRNSQYGDLFHVGPGNIESFTGMFYNNVLKVKDSNLISGKFHFNKGDIIYGKINPQLAKYVIAPFEGLASADAYVLNTKNGVVQNYLYAILQTEDFYKYTVSVSSRTGMPKINRDELNIYSYMSPDEEEQEKIGNYFQKLDTLINQHQQQITKLKNIKQACLSKMFV